MNEADRLHTLDEYRLIENSEDLGFDTVVQFASRFFGTSIALVTLIGQNKQIFKAKIGMDLCETDRRHSFCTHVVEADEVMVIPDALEDGRFFTNPLVIGPPFIRFYAGAPIRAANGHVLGAFCVIDTKPRGQFSHDERQSLKGLAKLVTASLESRRLLIANEKIRSQFESIARTSPDAIVCTDENGFITVWNHASEIIFGFSAEEAIGLNINIIVPARLQKAHHDGLMRVARGGKAHLIGKIVELDAVRKDGSEFPTEMSLSMWKAEGHARFCAIIRDISKRRANAARMFDLAFVDSLTLVPNRRVIVDRITEFQAEGKPFTLLMLDLDGFKDVNDTLGHHAGDAVLQQVAQRLLRCVREIDLVSRLGGDEFAILIPGDNLSNLVSETSLDILNALALPLDIEGRLVHITGSIGAAVSPAHGNKVGDLLAAADLAMYRAKMDGRACLRFFTPDMRQAVINRQALENEVRRAVELNEFELFYQPQVRITDGALLGVEALLRWRHPTEGLLTPYRFLSTIESGPFAVKVGLWVIATACAKAVELRQRVPNLTMGVNLFGEQFRTGKLVNDVIDILSDLSLPAEALELEINENIILRHDTVILTQLKKLRAMGVAIAFDDFGTGYASLSLLKEYPLTRLKIDRSFIESICTDASDAAIVDAVIHIARKLKLDVIAEGVENVEQCDFLNLRGCEVVQGYFHGKPMSASDLDIYIKNPSKCSHNNK